MKTADEVMKYVKVRRVALFLLQYPIPPPLNLLYIPFDLVGYALTAVHEWLTMSRNQRLRQAVRSHGLRDIREAHRREARGDASELPSGRLRGAFACRKSSARNLAPEVPDKGGRGSGGGKGASGGSFSQRLGLGGAVAAAGPAGTDEGPDCTTRKHQIQLRRMDTFIDKGDMSTMRGERYKRPEIPRRTLKSRQAKQSTRRYLMSAALRGVGPFQHHARTVFSRLEANAVEKTALQQALRQRDKLRGREHAELHELREEMQRGLDRLATQIELMSGALAQQATPPPTTMTATPMQHPQPPPPQQQQHPRQHLQPLTTATTTEAQRQMIATMQQYLETIGAQLNANAPAQAAPALPIAQPVALTNAHRPPPALAERSQPSEATARAAPLVPPPQLTEAKPTEAKATSKVAPPLLPLDAAQPSVPAVFQPQQSAPQAQLRAAPLPPLQPLQLAPGPSPQRGATPPRQPAQPRPPMEPPSDSARLLKEWFGREQRHL